MPHRPKDVCNPDILPLPNPLDKDREEFPGRRGNSYRVEAWVDYETRYALHHAAQASGARSLPEFLIRMALNGMQSEELRLQTRALQSQFSRIMGAHEENRVWQQENREFLEEGIQIIRQHYKDFDEAFRHMVEHHARILENQRCMMNALGLALAEISQLRERVDKLEQSCLPAGKTVREPD